MSCAHVNPGCTKCRLSKTRTRVVPGVGPCDSRIVFIGEAPGRDEDLAGKPFVGRAGKVLDGALKAAGVDREQVRITNLVKCRPPGNRRPRKDEVSICRPLHLDRELSEIHPQVVCVLGQTAASQFLGLHGPMSEVVGKESDVVIAGRPTKMLIAYHPAACLYQRKNLAKFNASVKAALTAAGMV